ncbi:MULTISPECIES: shikimate dehydrogenase [unclassified Coleofasciculus]|uniref:shikimate dehydrogenase n=1 Tax=unclassified Coleofasciculus TaxID=2692782 RepID=UPI00188022AA|nr:MULTISPECIES: shikimate dehydrogenase [unclassified Coleofasciculus]MBE9125413.1 shikimate dehydrogenase [Coleofasciculus sp. LEGE 07081]MBE9147370.1 shikimate dehydrogenase [Coleofasciculus sp. LEGE 07092]
MQQITGTTKLLGVIGHPVEHSLSPIMHNSAIAQLGVDYVYLPLPVKPEDLNVAIAGFAAIGLQGFNLTIPHKQGIIPLLSEVSDIARLVGAVNTVWRTDSGWSGTNTDVEGFITPLKADEQDWSQTQIVILGYGGAARAVVVGCMQLGCTQIHVVGRNREKLSQFQQSWANTSLSASINVYNWEQLPQVLPQADLLVNTTPVGMYPHIEQSPVDAVTMQGLREGAIAYDLIYTPNPTQFLKQAKQQGAITIDGLEMLVQQGAAALKIWLGQMPPVDTMRRSLQQQ